VGPFRRHLAGLVAALEASTPVTILAITACLTRITQLIEFSFRFDEIQDLNAGRRERWPKEHLGTRQFLDKDALSFGENPLFANLVFVP
jgi:hypothetical protein